LHVFTTPHDKHNTNTPTQTKPNQTQKSPPTNEG
jgi:hypothetical protein